jgi:hypothetical protein
MTKRTEILNEIENRIHFSANDSMLSHLKTVFFLRFGVSGSISPDGFRIWSFGFFFGALYPVITGEFSNDNDGVSLRISSKLNSFGMAIALITSGIWIGVVTYGIFQGDNRWKFLLPRSILGLILMLIPFITLGYAIFRNHQIQREEIKNDIQGWVDGISS